MDTQFVIECMLPPQMNTLESTANVMSLRMSFASGANYVSLNQKFTHLLTPVVHSIELRVL